MSKLLFQEQVERWGMLEVSCQGPAEGNPFVDHHIQGVFTGEKETVKTDGFYDGDGVYKVRFMPSFEGSYRFTISADFLEKRGDRKLCEPSCGGRKPWPGACG